MTSEPIRQALKSRRPFKVPHSEFAAMSPSGRLLFIAREGDRLETVDLLLVVSINEDGQLPAA
jgi:hypothetical protein